MEEEELVQQVRELRQRRYTPQEIARKLGIRSAEASRLVRAEAARRRNSGGGVDADDAPRCFVSPGWGEGLRIDGHEEWLSDATATKPSSGVGGLAFVLVAAPHGHGRVSMCGYLVDTWCLGVKDALGPKRVSVRELEAFRRRYFEPWGSAGVPIPIELARHLVLGAAEYARSLGFKPHRDLRRARGALGAWDGPSAITFGREGMPDYRSGPYDDPERVLATLERNVGRGGYHYTVELGAVEGPGDGCRYTAAVTDHDEVEEAA